MKASRRPGRPRHPRGAGTGSVWAAPGTWIFRLDAEVEGVQSVRRRAGRQDDGAHRPSCTKSCSAIARDASISRTTDSEDEQGTPFAKSSASRMAFATAERHRSVSGWSSGRRAGARLAEHNGRRATIARSGSFFKSSAVYFVTIIFASLVWLKTLLETATDRRRGRRRWTPDRQILPHLLLRRPAISETVSLSRLIFAMSGRNRNAKVQSIMMRSPGSIRHLEQVMSAAHEPRQDPASGRIDASRCRFGTLNVSLAQGLAPWMRNRSDDGARANPLLSVRSRLSCRRGVGQHPGPVLANPPGRNRLIARARRPSIPIFSLPVTSHRTRRERSSAGIR